MQRAHEISSVSPYLIIDARQKDLHERDSLDYIYHLILFETNGGKQFKKTKTPLFQFWGKIRYVCQFINLNTHVL